MMNENPYKIAEEKQKNLTGVRLQGDDWGADARSICLASGLLKRRIRILSPLSCLLDYRADRISDQIFVDDQLVVSRVPVFWLHERFDFPWEHNGKMFQFAIRLKVGRFLRILHFEILVDGICVYREPEAGMTEAENLHRVTS